MAKNRKHQLDKFYTKPDIVDLCLSLIDLNQFDTIVEPSAGAGAFSDKLPSGSIVLDIDPESEGIIQQDYLTFNPLEYGINGVTLVVGNPPFGNNSSLIFKFFKNSLYADCIAFILPKSFKKDSFQDKVPLNYHLTKEIDLPENSFTLNGNDYNVPCVFQIWERSDVFRSKSVKLQPKTFQFGNKDNSVLSIRRVGVNAGRLFMDTDRSIQSHHFIITDDVDGFVKKWSEITFNHDNTAGCPSISKQEVIKKVDYS